ncbi:MAG: acyl-CoA oxidase [Chloroflexi bacterium]|nr:MAG: acyl-CoA oxidase [Chloroflexota bacterium]
MKATTERLEAVDVARLQSFLDGRWASIRNEVRGLVRSSPWLRSGSGLSTDAYRARVAEQARALSQTKGARLFFPKSSGGEGDIGGALTAFEMIALVDLSLLVKIGVQWGLFGGVIQNLGTPKHHERYLRHAMTMDLPGCFAMTETGHGSDVQSVRTTATYDPQRHQFVVHTPDDDARKDYIGNVAKDGRMAAVFAQLITMGKSRGVHVLLVPIRDEKGRPCPGVRIEDCGEKEGLNGVDNGRLWFDEVRVPRDALLDRYGTVAPDGTYSSPIENETKRFFTMLGTLIAGRISVSGAALSATKLAQTIAVRYGLGRRQFHAPGSDQEVILLDYLQHQRRLLPAVATTYALHFAQESVVATLYELSSQTAGAERERRTLEALAAALKVATTWHATNTIQTCREACGGAGYLSVNQLPQLKADTDVFTTFEGDNTVLLQLVARGLLTNYREEFESLDTPGLVRFIADQAIGTVIERTAARPFADWIADTVPGSDKDTNLLDRKYHGRLFAWREKHAVETVARRLRKGMAQAGDAFAAFNAAQDHVLLAARAHIDRVVLERFVAAIDRCDDPDTKALLNKVCDLYVLSTLERDRAYFLEHGQLSAARAKAVILNVNRLCGELRPHARLLVDAFGIPEELITAPIA